MSESLSRNADATKVPRVVIVGGGLVGALNACFFAKRGWNVDLYEFREDIRLLEHVQGRSINLALSYRGRQALDKMGLQAYIVEQGVAMHARLVHDPDGTQHALPYGRPGQFIVSTNRRLLNEVMLSEAESYPNVRMFFQHKLQYYKLETGELVFERMTDDEKMCVKGDLLCGCDGAFSALRRSMMTVPKFDCSQLYINHGYIELCIQPSEDGEFKLEPNVFHLWPRGEFCMIALANKDRTFTVTLFAPWDVFDKLKVDDDTEKKKLLAFFDTNFPDAVPLIGKQEILDTFARVNASPLVSVKCKPHHFGDNILLLGDAAHAMVPFYGQGMNCGFEDCLVLSEVLDKHRDNISAAIREYSELRCPDAHAISDLAMYNYLELRHLVNQTKFKLRKKLDFFLNSLFPKSWIPMYTMVTFSRIRYHQVIKDRAWQDNILSRVQWGSASVLTIACALATFWAWKSGRLRLTTPKFLLK